LVAVEKEFTRAVRVDVNQAGRYVRSGRKAKIAGSVRCKNLRDTAVLDAYSSVCRGTVAEGKGSGAESKAISLQ
jgi:hypothetical protein